MRLAPRLPLRPALWVVLLAPAACAGVDTHVETGPIDTHVQANNVSGCITQRCMEETSTAAYEGCAEQCRKRFGQ